MNNRKSQQHFPRLTRYLLTLLVSSVLVACGQKGPLVLPESTADNSNNQQQEQNDNQD